MEEFINESIGSDRCVLKLHLTISNFFFGTSHNST